MQRKKHTGRGGKAVSQSSITDIDNDASLSASKGQALTEFAILPVQSKMNDYNSGPKTVEKDNFQLSKEKYVFYKCQYCTFFTMESDLMDNHMEQPTDECVKAISEKKMKQEQKSDKRKRLLDQEKSAKELQLTAYKTVRVNKIKPSKSKKNTNDVSRSKKIKPALMGNRPMKNPLNQRRKHSGQEKQSESKKIKQGAATKPQDHLEKTPENQHRTRYQTRFAGRQKKEGTQRPFEKKQIQTGSPKELFIPLPVVQLQQQMTDPPILAKTKEAHEAVEVSDLETSIHAPYLVEVDSNISEAEEEQENVEMGDFEMPTFDPEDLVEGEMLTETKEAQEAIEVSAIEMQIQTPHVMEVDMISEAEEAQETVEADDSDKSILVPMDLMEGKKMREVKEVQGTVEVSDPGMLIPAPYLIEVDMMSEAEEDQETAEVGNSKTQILVQVLMVKNMMTEVNVAQKGVEVEYPEIQIHAPFVMDVDMISEAGNDEISDFEMPILAPEDLVEGVMMTETKEAQEVIKVSATEMPINAPYLMEVDMISEAEEAQEPVEVGDSTMTILVPVEQEQCDLEKSIHAPYVMEVDMITETEEAQGTVQYPVMPILVPADQIEGEMTTDTKVAQESVEVSDPEMPILVPADLIEENMMTEAKQPQKVVEVSFPALDPMEENTMTEIMDSVDPLPVLQLRQQKVDPPILTREEAQETIEVSNPALSNPAPADLIEKNVIVEEKEVHETDEVSNLLLMETIQAQKTVLSCNDPEMEIHTPTNLMEGSMMMEEIEVVNRPSTPVSFMSPLELLAMITGKTPADEAKEILRVKSSEMSLENDICKLRLNFLRIDSIALRLSDLVKNEVHPRKLELVEERVRSIKERIDELEAELATFRKIEESLSSKFKEAQKL